MSGLAGVVNGISPQARNYFAAGALGVIIGDFQLPRYGLERIFEVYYKASTVLESKAEETGQRRVSGSSVLPSSVMVTAMSAPDDPLRRPPGFLASFAAATAFLTRVPIDTPAPGTWQLADAAWAFPLVGAGIGAVAGLAFLLAQLVGLADWPAALLSVLSGLALDRSIA